EGVEQPGDVVCQPVDPVLGPGAERYPRDVCAVHHRVPPVVVVEAAAEPFVTVSSGALSCPEPAAASRVTAGVTPAIRPTSPTTMTGVGFSADSVKSSEMRKIGRAHV